MDQRDGETSPGERMAWLAQMCRLEPLALELFALLAGMTDAASPSTAWWTLAAAARRLGVDELEVRRQLLAGSPLIEWGLVRTAPAPRSQLPGEARVAVNERIAQFLWRRRNRASWLTTS